MLRASDPHHDLQLDGLVGHRRQHPERSAIHRPGRVHPDGAGGQGDGDFSQAELQGYVDTLTDAAGNINSDSQLDMVHLQSLMSQQQTAVSLTTNLVQSLGDQENKIADNIGH